ncbi:uncharacterized protein [Amphiura filiformis]|uniref:uncharacterized protein n=1 Tax=Amphiura filiformis TaxID=82378 RepID=UPI003B22138D
MANLPKMTTNAIFTMTLIPSIIMAQTDNEDFDVGEVVGLTIGGMVMLILIVVIIAFSIFMYMKHMCICFNQRRYDPKIPPVQFKSFTPGPYQTREKLASPFSSIIIATMNRHDNEDQPDDAVETKARTKPTLNPRNDAS